MSPLHGLLGGPHSTMKNLMKRLDVMTVLGLVLVLIGVFIEVFAKTGKETMPAFKQIMLFVNTPAFFLILFSSLGATIIGHGWAEFKTTPRLVTDTFRAAEIDPEKTINLLASLSEKARREGLLKLEDELKSIDDLFMREGLQLVIDGTDMELLQKMLVTKIDAMRERHRRGESFFTDWGGYAPTIGIIGTVMGLIHVLSLGFSDTSALGEGIARAFLATFYGIASANLLILPVAGKLRLRSQEEAFAREMMIEGILSIQSGDNPRLLREKLMTYLPPKSEVKPKKIKLAPKLGKRKAVENKEVSQAGSPR